MSSDGRPLTTTAYMEETIHPDPAERQLSRDLRDHLLREATDRFANALREGVSVRMEVGQAFGVFASWASDRATEGDRFRSAGEAVAAGYAWRFCERPPDRAAATTPETSPFFGPSPARKRYVDLEAAEPGESPMMRLVTAAAQSVGAGDPVWEHSPGGLVYGRAFLGHGVGLARASLVAAAWMNDEQFETLFLDGVCLRDAEPALPQQLSETAGVSVDFTLAGPASSSEAHSSEHAPATAAAAPRFCTHCGAPASTGPYCSQCGRPMQ